jgi:hypothetical protein
VTTLERLRPGDRVRTTRDPRWATVVAVTSTAVLVMYDNEACDIVVWPLTRR